MPAYGSDTAQVLNVYGSPGPGSGITMDAQVMTPAGPVLHAGVKVYGLPDDRLDVRIILGVPAWVIWITDTEGLWFAPWIPEFEVCA